MLISLMGLNILILCFIRLLHSLRLDQSIGCNLKRKTGLDDKSFEGIMYWCLEKELVLCR